MNKIKELKNNIFQLITSGSLIFLKVIIDVINITNIYVNDIPNEKMIVFIISIFVLTPIFISKWGCFLDYKIPIPAPIILTQSRL